MIVIMIVTTTVITIIKIIVKLMIIMRGYRANRAAGRRERARARKPGARRTTEASQER